MARLYPHKFFLGVERLKLRYEKTRRRVACFPNAAVWRAECHQAVETLLPRAGIDTIHISFPDPWPKRRHHSRRLVSPEFLRKCISVLVPNGQVRLMTDHLGYFHSMRTAVKGCDELFEEEWNDSQEAPMTEFQKRFVASGIKVHRLALRKIESIS